MCQLLTKEWMNEWKSFILFSETLSILFAWMKVQSLSIFQPWIHAGWLVVGSELRHIWLVVRIQQYPEDNTYNNNLYSI